MTLQKTRKGRLRQQFLGNWTVPEPLRIRDVVALRHHLQTAIEIEHATIPAYLTALYSIRDGTNQASVNILRSVVMEEMLHLILAANVLNAIGGSPSVNGPRFIPSYPTPLPHSNDAFLVHLAPFSADTMATFVRIEQPTPAGTDPEFRGYATIGQFYAAVKESLVALSAEADIFTGDPSRQVTPEHYYGGGGEIVVVTGSRDEALTAALAAIDEILGQGEGLGDSMYDGDPGFGHEIELAHYYRFNQILAQKYYQPGDDPSKPTGADLAVDYTAVFPMRTDLKVADLPAGSEVRQRAVEFNVAYSTLLDGIHDALNGRPDRLLATIPRMYDLRYRATALMQMPLGANETAAPTFEYVER